MKKGKDETHGELREEIIKQSTRGQAIADDDGGLENYAGTPYTNTGDRITPYKADKDLGEKGNAQE